MKTQITLSIQMNTTVDDDPYPNITVAELLNQIADDINYNGLEGQFHDKESNLTGFLEIWDVE